MEILIKIDYINTAMGTLLSQGNSFFFTGLRAAIIFWSKEITENLFKTKKYCIIIWTMLILIVYNYGIRHAI